MNTQHASSDLETHKCIGRMLAQFVDDTEEHNLNKGRVLAGFLEACLMSDEAKPFHVHAPDIMTLINKWQVWDEHQH